MSESDPILEIENVSVSYNGNMAVSNVFLKATKGSILGIVGPNGAGKTTLLRAILNLVPLSSGQILFGGKKINSLPTFKVVCSGITMTIQHAQTLNSLSVEDNVLIGFLEGNGDGFLKAFIRGRGARVIEAERRKIVKEILRLVGLAVQQDVVAGSLSYGQKKRLDIARALASDPKLVLMDEPTAGIDPGGIEEVLTILRKIKADGKTILLVEHNMEAVRNICDEIVVMDFGEKIAHGRPENVLKDRRVIEAYLGGNSGDG